MNSPLIAGGPVAFPPNTGERVYMLPFFQDRGLPGHLGRWQPTVDAMLEGHRVHGPAYLMVDQGVVLAGLTQRRPGPHVDGWWDDGLRAHGVPGHRQPAHRQPVPQHRQPIPGHRHGPPGHGQGPGPAQSILLASDVSASCAWVGTWAGEPGKGGDCEHVSLSGLERVPLNDHRTWVGSAIGTLHASLPVPRVTPRTLVRINAVLRE